PAPEMAPVEVPAEEPPLASPAPAAAPPAAAPPAASSEGEDVATPSGLTLVDVRRLWPDLLESVKDKRRFTWILLSQNAQVAAVDDKVLTVALVNAGARQSFSAGGSEEILRQAAIDVIGHDWRIEAIVDPTAQPGSHQDVVTRSAVAPEPETEEPEAASVVEPAATPVPSADEAPADRRPADPQAIASARDAILATRPQGEGRRRQVDPSMAQADADVDRDDADADDDLGGAQLLQRELGASIIEEIKHD
ncbi:MAG: DNA polymerase III subunit gamma/tau, partial [Nocardioides sp.]